MRRTTFPALLISVRGADARCRKAASGISYPYVRRETMNRTTSIASALGMPTVAAATVLLGMGQRYALAQEQEGGARRAPIVIASQGSFFVGGRTVFRQWGNDGNAESRFNPGHVTINQMYVQYQVPYHRKFKYPVVLFHGGGHHGKVYETTPDGREGWNTVFLRRGFTVYVVDGVNRGRSGYDITDMSLVKQGREAGDSIPLINRYTHEVAWTQFRIGPEPGTKYPTSQFPVRFFDQYVKQLVPAWRDTIEDVRNVAALVALLDRIGPAILVTWSQSGRFGWNAALRRPNLVKGIVALEPAAFPPELSPEELEVLSRIPIILEAGDFDPERIAALKEWAALVGPRASVLALPEIGIFGNGHVVMQEKNNRQVARVIIRRLAEKVPGLRLR
jgi:pimeloyl-ACP methyl ester carboxylesterase